MVCLLFPSHCSHHEGNEEHEKNLRKAGRTLLDSFPRSEISRGFFPSCPSWWNIPFVCSSMSRAGGQDKKVPGGTGQGRRPCPWDLSGEFRWHPPTLGVRLPRRLRLLAMTLRLKRDPCTVRFVLVTDHTSLHQPIRAGTRPVPAILYFSPTSFPDHCSLLSLLIVDPPYPLC